MTRRRITADAIIRPMAITCGKCADSATLYPHEPDTSGQAATFCPTCSPAWSQSFFAFLTDQYRESLGLTRLEEAGC